MAAFTYTTTFFVNQRNLTAVADPDQLISEYPEGSHVYIDGTTTRYGKTTLDISKYLLLHSNITATTTQEIVNSLSDLLVDRYRSSDIPTLNSYTGAYTTRMNVFDPNVDPRMTIEYTTMNVPNLRGVLSTRSICRDIVIHSTEVDLANCVFTVNGIVHKQTYDAENNDLYLIDGYINCRRKGAMELCCMDFSKLGGISFQAITASDIKKATNVFDYLYLNSDTDMTGKMPILVVDGYVHLLNDVFTIVGPHTLRLNCSLLDLASMFIQSPMTPFSRGVGYDPAGDTIPTDGNGLPAIVDRIRKFLAEYHNESIDYTDDAGIGEFEFNDLYYELQRLLNSAISMGIFFNLDYLVSILTDTRSMIILIDNPAIYTRTYHPVYMSDRMQYDCYSEDTPRGLLKYNTMFIYPYTILSNTTNKIHHITVGLEKITRDIYKDCITRTVAPSPRVDEQQPGQGFPIEMLELYSK